LVCEEVSVKRLIVLAVLAVVLIPASPASASVNVRTDFDDTTSVLDIQQLGTDVGPDVGGPYRAFRAT
jgi:hypothetical protein